MRNGEKRKHRRAEVELPVRYRETFGSAPGYYEAGWITDISAGGLRFQTEDFIACDTRLIFEIHLPASPKPVRAISAVSWTRALPADVRYEVGGRFTDIVPSEKILLQQFLENRIRGRA